MVEIPDDALAKVRNLLDPKPSTLREQVADVIDRTNAVATLDAADAVLAVVADWLAAQPRTPLSAVDLRHAERNQRDHDVRLLRGAS